MSTEFAPEYQFHFYQKTSNFSKNINLNWIETNSKAFLEKIENDYFKPIENLCKELDQIKKHQQLIWQYLYPIMVEIESSGDSSDPNNWFNSSLSDRIYAQSDSDELLYIEKEINSIQGELFGNNGVSSFSGGDPGIGSIIEAEFNNQKEVPVLVRTKI